MRTDLPRGVIAVIGSGGKSTLIDVLARRLEGTVIVCTSTHIFPSRDLPLVTEPIRVLPAPKICMGVPAEHGKLQAPRQSFRELANLADYVLVEADGARHHPLKAHLDYEPVIPAEAVLTIQVVGLSGLGKPVEAVCHRPERYGALCGSMGPVTPEMAAAVLNKENLADCYLLNQADSLEDLQPAERLAALLEKPARIVSLQKE